MELLAKSHAWTRRVAPVLREPLRIEVLDVLDGQIHGIGGFGGQGGDCGVDFGVGDTEGPRREFDMVEFAGVVDERIVAAFLDVVDDGLGGRVDVLAKGLASQHCPQALVEIGFGTIEDFHNRCLFARSNVSRN